MVKSGSQSRSSNIARDRIESQETIPSSIFGTSPDGADDLLSDIMKDVKPKTNLRTENGSILIKFCSFKLHSPEILNNSVARLI